MYDIVLNIAFGTLHIIITVIITGDFNASHQLWFGNTSNVIGSILHDYLVTSNFAVINNSSPTRKDKVIDLTIVSNAIKNKICEWKVQEEVFLKSDHRLITFEIGRKKENKVWERWDFKNVCWKTWENQCDVVFGEWLQNMEVEDDVDKLYQNLCEKLLKLAEVIIPKKSVCSHSRGWWNEEIGDLIKKVRKAKRRLNKRSDAKNYQDYTNLMTQFKDAELRAKDKYLSDLVSMLNPKDPQKFWNIINKSRKDQEKTIVQPIRKEDGSYAIDDDEIIVEMKKHYGKESLDVKDNRPDWFHFVEKEVEAAVKSAKEDISRKIEDENFENSALDISEVTRAIEATNSRSAPSPEEKIFTILIQKGGDNLHQCMHFLFNKCWVNGVICKDFKKDPKILLPKAGKDDYNKVRAYRPITLESVIGKIFQRAVAERLRWKLEVFGGTASTQDAYRKQHSCVQTVTRLTNQLHEARMQKKHSAMIIMDFQSCFEKVWRAGLLFKALKIGINGKLLVYLHNYLTDRQYCLHVNDGVSEWITSKVGIPQGAVLSPLLCNLYTSDSMDEVTIYHTEFADDNVVLDSNENLQELASKVSVEGDKVAGDWCGKWNMGIEALKTQALIVSPPNMDVPDVNIKLKGQDLEIVKE